MELLKKLNDVQSTEDFVCLVNENGEKLFDFFSIINYSELIKSKKEFHKLALKANLIVGESVKTEMINAFVVLVLNTSIRLGDRLVFQRFHEILIRNNAEKSLLIRTSCLFMINVRSFSDYKNRIDDILNGLEQVYFEESDSKKDSISALVSFYSNIVSSFLEFASESVIEIRDLIKKEYDNKRYSFLDDVVIDKICSIDLVSTLEPIKEIQQLLDSFLANNKRINFNPSPLLIENSTTYSSNFDTLKTLTEIVYLNKSIYEPIKNDRIFHSLDRGVKIIEEELQLLAYVYSFGSMHQAKLETAISFLPEISTDHTLIDWGCGQGLGALMYLEKRANCTQCILIEPSEVALKRASLHIKNWNSNLCTINKTFDDLRPFDFKIINNAKSFVHMFSNVLDMDLFSLEHLITQCENNCKGLNYFVVSSPYIDSTRTERIDTFISHFRKYSSFEMINKITEKKGQWRSTNWSRVIRVFKVEIA